MAGENTLEFLIKLNEDIASPATKAESALTKLEKQIRREEDAIGSFERKIVAAQKRLTAIEAGDGNGRVNIKARDDMVSQIREAEGHLAAHRQNYRALTGDVQRFQAAAA